MPESSTILDHVDHIYNTKFEVILRLYHCPYQEQDSDDLHTWNKRIGTFIGIRITLVRNLFKTKSLKSFSIFCFFV